jgi:threonine dehydrogenase-like Zn-dependent dehydrogenase
VSGNATVVFPAARQAVFEDRPIPTPGRGEVLIRTEWSLLSAGTELSILSGDFPTNSAWGVYGKFPFVAGYSAAGVVEAVGDDSPADLIGRRVASKTPHAQWAVSPLDEIRVLDDAIDPKDATFFVLAETVLNGLRRGDVRFGEAVVVCGLGILGQLATRFSRLSGARPVFGVDIVPRRLALLPDDPSLIRIDARSDVLPDVVRAHNHGRLADAVIELTGEPSLIPGEFAALREQGRFVVLASPRGEGTVFNFHDLCNRPSFTIIGAHIVSHPQEGGSPDQPWSRPRHSELFFDLLRTRELDVSSLISDVVSYREAPGVMLRLLDDRSGIMAMIFDWNGGG